MNARDLIETAHGLTELSLREGIGWEMNSGKIQHRGPVSSFGHRTQEVVDDLRNANLSKAANEIQEAIADISRRPTADITGAVHHAMCAAEATARELAGERKKTLGDLVPTMRLKPPLGQAIEKLWGYASNEARHGTEMSSLTRPEAQLIVEVAGALCSFLVSRNEEGI